MWEKGRKKNRKIHESKRLGIVILASWIKVHKGIFIHFRFDIIGLNNEFVVKAHKAILCETQCSQSCLRCNGMMKTVRDIRLKLCMLAFAVKVSRLLIYILQFCCYTAQQNATNTMKECSVDLSFDRVDINRLWARETLYIRMYGK